MPNTDFNIHHSMLLKQRDGTVDMDFSSVGLTDETVGNIVRIFIIVDDLDAHAAFVAKHVMENLSGVQVRFVLAPEISVKRTSFNCNELLIVFPEFRNIEETYADLRRAKEEGQINLALVDAPEESYSRYQNTEFLTNQDNEINIDMAYRYGEQLVACYELAVKIAYVRKKIDNEEYQNLLRELLTFMDEIQGLIRHKDRIQWWATKQADIKNFFIVGNDIDYEVGLETSNIIKKVSGFSCTAYDADEMAREINSQYEDGAVVLFILTQKSSYEKINRIMIHCKNLGAHLVAVTMFGNFDVEEIADFTVYLPKMDARFAASLAVVPLALLGYDIDLAKVSKENKR